MFGKKSAPGVHRSPEAQWGDGYTVHPDPSHAPRVDEMPHDVATEVFGRLAALEELQAGHIDDLTAQLAERERTVTAMNEAVASSRRDQVAVFLAPAAKKLIDLGHQLRRAAAQQYEKTGDARAGADLDYFGDQIEDTLETLGFERVDCSVGMSFDPRRHQAARTEATSREEQDRTVASVLRPGYAFVGSTKTAFPATVIVYEYVDPSEEN